MSLSRIADLFFNALTLEDPASMKNYGPSQNCGNNSLCSAANIATAKKNLFLSILPFWAMAGRMF